MGIVEALIGGLMQHLLAILATAGAVLAGVFAVKRGKAKAADEAVDEAELEMELDARREAESMRRRLEAERRAGEAVDEDDLRRRMREGAQR